ncbi:hypothetical protein IT407_00465 [Candidatus Uhrbacteria bacterium]|nr:hypothetical protein [Candidatus Uhrbacteria bacterium]
MQEKLTDAIWIAGQRVFVPVIRYGSIFLLCVTIILCTILAGNMAADDSARGVQGTVSGIAYKAIKSGLPIFGIGGGFIGLLILPIAEKIFILLLMVIVALMTRVIA